MMSTLMVDAIDPVPPSLLLISSLGLGPALTETTIVIQDVNFSSGITPLALRSTAFHHVGSSPSHSLQFQNTQS
ncbi:hypothetical protein DTO006G1_6978 [Penicillium roqueforti]|nr:hypothetical protein LCP963914a_6485 [Penicillium roqueforti]KAI2699204.1 hypothetical protein CBS147372_6451 [Penicillium roqueforti]KAI2725014.1 hypothetical protein CBS147354_5331 [Penicillium roqueforti]KAI2739245.1 hypothetical protein DTO012A1_6073 [Penicillium roqueforti]KAI2758158.1 hypothetical protein DTO006G1_6978 [Penicillium roqueforti]